LGWERIAFGHTTHVDSSLDLKEALISPVSTPGVLNDPVVNTVFGSVSYSNNSMVHIRWRILAYVRGIDTT